MKKQEIQPEQIIQPEQSEQPEQIQEPNLNNPETTSIDPFPEQVSEFVQQEEQTQTQPNSQTIGAAGYDDSGVLTLDGFQNGFIAAFDVAGDLTGLKSFPVKDYERAGALKTAEKLYTIALKYPAFRFLIDRKSYWLYDWSLIAGFVAMKTNDVLEEKFNYSMKNKIFGWLKWNKSDKTGKESGFLGRLVRVKQQKQDN